MRRLKESELHHLVNTTTWPVITRTKAKPARQSGTLLVDRVVLQYALENRKQKQLATYLRFRFESYLNAGWITQDMLKSSTDRNHLTWLRRMGWVRRTSRGRYQIVSMRTIARGLGKGRIAAAMTKEQWKDPIAACYAGWLSCFARTWKSEYQGVAVSDEVKRHHFVIASAGMISGVLGVSERTILLWKERAWKFYWQKESVSAVITEKDWSAGMAGGVDLGHFRKRGRYRIKQGPNVYFNFQLAAVRRDHL